MSLSPSVVTALVTIGFGAVAGGVTNAVAIWMLFHPYQPRGPRWFRLQGAIPKNRARLAKTVGRTVGQRLLLPDDLARQLGAPGVREAFDRAIRNFVREILDVERGPLRQELPPGVVTEIESVFATLAPLLADRLAAFAATDGFRERAERFVTRAAGDLADRPLGEVLTSERRSAIRQRVEQWVADAAASPDLEATVGGWLERQLARFAHDETPLLDRLPPGLVATVERGIAGYLPVALDRLGSVLADPGARARVQRALHELFQRFVRNLMLHERIVARLVVTEKTIARVLDTFEREGVDHLARLLDEPALRAQVAASVNDAVVTFLRRPIAEHLRNLGPERVAALRATAATYVAGALRDPGTRMYAIDRLDQALAAAERRTFGEVLRHVPTAQAAAWLTDAAGSPLLRAWVEESVVAALAGLLEKPIGRPAARLPAGTTDRLGDALAPALWTWVQGQVPTVVAHLDIEGLVEQKVLGFSIERVEEIIRATTQRELDLIVRLGYVLGAIVGAMAFVVSVLLT